MQETVSIHALKDLVEKKIKKKVLLKVIWNDQEKITLFMIPNMKINSFIRDEKEGYIFFDTEGKQIKQEIPCVLSEDMLVDGLVVLKDTLRIHGERLSKEDKQFFKL